MTRVSALHWRLARLAGFAFALLGACAVSQAAQPPAFDFERLSALAHQNSQTLYRSAPAQLPAELLQLDYDGLRDLRFQPAKALWRDAQLPFEAMFFHLGQNHRQPVRIH